MISFRREIDLGRTEQSWDVVMSALFMVYFVLNEDSNKDSNKE